MTSLTALYYRLFQPLLTMSRKAHEDTTRALRSARLSTFSEWYLSFAYFSAFAAAAIAGVIGAVALAFGVYGHILLKLLGQPLVLLRAVLDNLLVLVWGIVLVTGLMAIVAILVYLGFLLYPRMRATARARRIDEEFPSVVTLCYALARGGMPPLEIFRVVAKEKDTYGEISTEFALVVRDVDWFGQDLNTALLATAQTTPSDTLKRFFEGLVTILNSGALAKDFFKRQAENQLEQSEMNLEKDLEQAALLAEVYVSGLLVLPLLLIVIMSIMSALGGGIEAFLPLIVFGLIPLGTVGYLIMLDMMLPGDILAAPKLSLIHI